MKLNNKGFAVSTFMYMILLLAIILIFATLAILSSRRMILDKQKSNTIEKISQVQNPICESVSGTRSLELGTEYRCEVKDDTFFNFYLLSVEGSKVNLIMDRNICEDGTAANNNYCSYGWHVDEENPTQNDSSKGPDTAISKLRLATNNWNNVPLIYINYDNEAKKVSSNYGYGKIIATKTSIKIYLSDNTTISYSDNEIRARLAKQSEVNGVGCDYTLNSCPAWLLTNLDNVLGFWLLPSYPMSSYNAMVINKEDQKISSAASSNVTDYGLRPVITLPKSMLK